MARKQCSLICFRLENLARKQCFLIYPSVREIARKQCFLICPSLENMARKQCFLICFRLENLARKQCFLVCSPLVSIARKQCPIRVYFPLENMVKKSFSGLTAFGPLRLNILKIIFLKQLDDFADLFIIFILEIRSKLESRCSPRVFSHQSRVPPSRHSSRAPSQQSVYVPPAQSLEAAAQRPPSHQSIKSQQSVLKSILEYKPEKE